MDLSQPKTFSDYPAAHYNIHTTPIPTLQQYIQLQYQTDPATYTIFFFFLQKLKHEEPKTQTHNSNSSKNRSPEIDSQPESNPVQREISPDPSPANLARVVLLSPLDVSRSPRFKRPCSESDGQPLKSVENYIDFELPPYPREGIRIFEFQIGILIQRLAIRFLLALDSSPFIEVLRVIVWWWWNPSQNLVSQVAAREKFSQNRDAPYDRDFGLSCEYDLNAYVWMLEGWFSAVVALIVLALYSIVMINFEIALLVLFERKNTRLRRNTVVWKQEIHGKKLVYMTIYTDIQSMYTKMGLG
ncbi:hypothetical protein H5410_006938 [Solanum commersonii]|uniref:Uncharacterized protein n=1 Tax=Solanum commersonii TaxID=4109 RepID=A0A9J6AB56_SOLCO|nr:hypothetical protein H5410_006938 [Solanum commersonii]